MNVPDRFDEWGVSVDSERSLAELVARLVDRLDEGESLDPDAFAAEHPGYDDRLRELFPALAMMAGMRLAGRPEDEPVVSLGDFRTVRVLGRGGMGVVYEAVQVSLNRRVALKILPAVSAGDPRRLKRFQVEAQAAACLHHPHIVPIHVVGSEEGVHYYAMQLIEGRTLAEVIARSRRGGGPGARQVGEPTRPGAGIRPARAAETEVARGDRPGPRAAAELARQAAEALHFAHEQGILHRDVKPSNLLVDASGSLWVADFGLARLPGEGDLTATGDLLGTLRYMSPEQALGARALVDRRADVYSLGATLYELLTLRPPFDDEDRLELLRKIAQDEARPVRRLEPAIPGDLETIVAKAMAKDPAERYATAGDLAADLRRFLEDRPILARAPGPLDLASKWARRHTTAVAVASVVALAAVLGLGAAGLWRDRLLRDHNRELRDALGQSRLSAWEAAEQRAVADRHEQATRLLLYDSQMKLADQERRAGRVEFAQEILEELRPGPGGGDVRGFEWHFLRRLCHRDVSVLFGHEAAVYAMALSPDGRTLASGDGDGVLILWDLADWRRRCRVQAHSTAIAGLTFSRDGRMLGTWASDVEKQEWGEATLRDPATGREIARLTGISGIVTGLTFAPDGRELAVTWREIDNNPATSVAEFRDLSRDSLAATVKGPSIACSWLAYSPDGRSLATVKEHGEHVLIRDVATRQPRLTLPGPLAWARSLAYSPNGRTIAAASGGGMIFWNQKTGRRVGTVGLLNLCQLAYSRETVADDAGSTRSQMVPSSAAPRGKPWRITMDEHGETVNFAALSADSRTMAVGGRELPLALWDLPTGRRCAECPGNATGVRSLAFAPGGRSVMFSCEDSRIRSWHFDERPDSVVGLAGHEAEVWALAYTPDGQLLASAGDDHLIKLWDPHDATLRATLAGHEQLVTALAVSPDGATLASASFDGTLRLWSLPEGRPLGILRGHTGRVRAVAFSPDGRTLASASADMTVRLWDPAAIEAAPRVLKGHGAQVLAVAFAPDGRTLASSGNDRTIRLWDPAEGREIRSLKGPNIANTLAFSPDGTTLAAGEQRGYVSFWDAATWSRRALVRGGTDAYVFGLAFSPDGRTLASASGDAKVRLWDPATGQVTLVLDGHDTRVNAVAFSPNGRTLASASHDGSLKLWLAASP